MSVAAERAKSVLIFVAHQFVGTWGIGLLAALGLTSLFDVIPDSARWKPSMHSVYWLLADNPFYPLQIMVGLYLGWRISRRFQHKSMLWIWVLPLAALGYAVTVGLVLIPEWTSVLTRPRTVGARFSHYFGWGCQPRAHCLDQLLITMPFYASVAYALGALLARRALKKTEQVPPLQEQMLPPD
jgi:hypothetical protein